MRSKTFIRAPDSQVTRILSRQTAAGRVRLVSYLQPDLSSLCNVDRVTNFFAFIVTIDEVKS